MCLDQRLGIMGDPLFDCASRSVPAGGWRSWPSPRFFSIGGTQSRGTAGRGGGQRHRRWFRAPARCRSEAPTGRTGQRSKPSPRFFTIGGTRFPLSRAILPLGGTRREGRHPDGWGLRGRGPAGRCAGPHREDWPEVGVPWPAGHDAGWGWRSTGRTAQRSCLSRAVCALTGTCREGGHPEGWSLRGRGPAGRCADREVGVPVPAGRDGGWGWRCGRQRCT